MVTSFLLKLVYGLKIDIYNTLFRKSDSVDDALKRCSIKHSGYVFEVCICVIKYFNQEVPLIIHSPKFPLPYMCSFKLRPSV